MNIYVFIDYIFLYLKGSWNVIRDGNIKILSPTDYRFGYNFFSDTIYNLYILLVPVSINSSFLLCPFTEVIPDVLIADSDDVSNLFIYSCVDVNIDSDTNTQQMDEYLESVGDGIPREFIWQSIKY